MTNPLLSKSSLEYELPDFQNLKDEHYLPAFENAVQVHNQELAQIKANPEITFENTLLAMERSGDLLNSMMMVFYNKSASDTNPTLQDIEAVLAPKLSNHLDSIKLDPELFKRLLTLEKSDHSALDDESRRLLEKYLEDFRFAGAELSEAERAEVSKINEKLASLSAEFDKLLLADSNDLAIELDR